MSTSEPCNRTPVQSIKGVPISTLARRARSARNHRNMRTIRGYRVHIVGAQLKATHIFWRAFPDLPRAFIWHNADFVEVARYIDHLYAKNSKATVAAENDAHVSALEYPTTEEVGKREWYTANAESLLACLALRSSFDVPIWGRVRFLTDGSYLVPAEYIGALITAHPREFGHLNREASWREATEKDLVKMGLRPDQVTTGMYRTASAAPPEEVADELAAPADADDQLPPVEATIRRHDHGEYIDWVTRADQGAHTWYIRRLYRRSTIFYEATSWNPQGPWRVWSRDASIMLALGVTG